jgi:sialic acid synthase SpsE
MCGPSGAQKRVPPKKETQYLDARVRGVYAKRDLVQGELIRPEDFYLAVPLQKGQISCRELMNGEKLIANIKADAPILIDHIDSPYAGNPELRASIYKRGN